MDPPKIVQYRKDYLPYLDSDIRQQQTETQDLLATAINSQDQDDWTAYINKRNTTQKIINKAKKQYTTYRLGQTNNKWRTIKNMNNTNKIQPPNKLKHNNTIITSPKQLCTIANEFFIN